MSRTGTIFCSKCGAGGQRVESYYRSCGEWLPDPAAAMTPRGRMRRMSPERKHRRMRVLELLSAAAALASAFFILTVLTGSDLGLLVIPLLLCFAVVGWQTVAFFMGRSIQGKRGQEQAEGSQTLSAAQAGARPELNAADTTDLIPPPSVTENTTTLLDPVPVKKGVKK